jgi:hypothetical protein
MNTDELVAHGRVRFEHTAARRLLKEKYQAKLTFAYRGGMWCAGPELLTLLQAVPVEDDVVILDLYENPVRVDPLELHKIAFDRWQEQMTAWLLEFENTNQKR